MGRTMLSPNHRPLLKAKLARPLAPRMSLSRPRLLALLSEAIHRPFTLLCAPAGFGKSSLLSTWAAEATHQPISAWLVLDDEDNDPARFFEYIHGALRAAGVDIGGLAAPAHPGAASPSAKDRMAVLLDDLADLTQPVMLVLDDYHLVHSAELDAALSFLVEHAPENFCLVMATRETPRLPLARWRSKEWMSEIGASQLRFTQEESAAYLSRCLRLTIDAPSLEALATRTEGWVAGLQMAGLSLQRHVEVEGGARLAQVVSAFNGEHSHVIEYLAAEVMRLQSCEINDFVRKVCVLDRFSAELCDALTERSDSHLMLVAVERGNLFLQRLDDHGRWFRFHQLFADFLRNGLAPSEAIALHRKASAWFEACGRGPEAMKHALAARSEHDAVRLFRLQVEDLLARGELPTLLSWLEMLPPALVRQHQDLAAYKAWLLFMSGRTTEAMEYHGVATALGEQSNRPEPPEILFSLQAFIAINSDQPELAIELSEQALRRLGNTTSFFRLWPLFYSGLGLLRMGSTRQAADVLRQAVDLAWSFGHRLTALDALGHLIPLMSAQGQLREAKLLCQEFLSQCSPSDEAHAPISGLLLIPMGMLAYERNELREAIEWLEVGTGLCKRLGSVFHALAGTCALARAYHASGMRDDAWNAVAAARELADRSRNPRRRRAVFVVSADLHLREGNVDAARLALEEVGPALEVAIEAQLLRARVLLSAGETLAGMRTLVGIEDACRQQGQLGTLISVLLLQAIGHRANGGRAATVERLDKAVSLAASGGYLRPFLDADTELTPLLRHTSLGGSAFVEELLRSARQPQVASTAVPEAAPMQLTRTQLEVLLLIGKGLGNQQIAEQLVITVGTAKWHVSQIFEKLGVRNRSQAVAKARESFFI
jgi:LuxR family maltose regulon positive regulatory protein